ncbi:MAG: GntR family transcriptional regulator [Spirochaetales bacterium]|nr:GntR family transcriptional regulator [Spirochaetales bacterium]
MTVQQKKLKKKLTEIIRNESFPDNRLPSELEMAGRLNVSRMTYRGIVQELVQDGLLLVRHGRGTFIIPPLPSIPGSMERLESLGRMIRESGFTEGESRRKITVQRPDSEISNLLNLKKGEKVLRIERIRYADDEPVAFSQNYLPYSLVGRAFEENEFSGSLLQFLEDHCRIRISCADCEICPPEENREFAEKALDYMGKGRNLLFIKQNHYDEENHPVLFTYEFLRSDIFRFRIRRRR